MVRETEEICVVKKYVDVTAAFFADGRMRPLWITWEDGRRFEVDKVLDCRRAASMKAGGTGIRYTCLICGSRHYLFYEENYKWFVECRQVGNDRDAYHS